MKPRIRIAILMHELDRLIDLRHYLIYYFAEIWREQGHSVVFVFGTDEFIPADIALLHIDLSIVPAAYIAFSQRYPVTLNSNITDIRKSTLPGNRLRYRESYDGPVIVKSNLNNAGLPEKRLENLSMNQGTLRKRFWIKLCQSWRERTMCFTSACDYQIFDNIAGVPRACFINPHLIVQRFLPEIENDLYHLRVYHFLGNSGNCSRITSYQPIVTGGGAIHSELVEPHPDIVALRMCMGFDYGKFDYVQHDGNPVLLDINKTTGRGNPVITPERMERWRERAAGLFSYLE